MAEDETLARRLILEGLGERFGFIDEGRNPDLDTILEHYLLRGHRFFVAEQGGAVVGTAGLVFEAGGAGRIVRMSVAESHRRRGVARALLRFATRVAQSCGLGELRVATQPEWHDAVALYRSEGFVPFGRDEIDVHLRRELELEL